jgi:hypothetical protein
MMPLSPVLAGAARRAAIIQDGSVPHLREMADMGISYRLISTYVTDSQNLDQGWYGPHSGVAFHAAGTSTPWGSNFAVSAFDAGGGFGSGSMDVLNVGSSYGSDELNLSSLLTAHRSGYSVADAPVFSWNGNPVTPGFGCDYLSINAGSMTDALDPADWGLVKAAEYSINSADAASIRNLAVSGFAVTNVRYDGVGSVSVFGAQSGTYDFSHATGQVNFMLSPASLNNGFGTQDYVVEASASGGFTTIAYAGYGISATHAYNGATLTLDGSTSKLDFYDTAGRNNVDLSEDKISANLYLKGNSASLTFMGGSVVGSDGVLTAGGNEIKLSQGAAHITASDASGLSWLNNFTVGLDSIDMTIAGNGDKYSIFNVRQSGGETSVAITDDTGSHGLVLAGGSSGCVSLTVADLSGHISTGMVDGVEHLYIS